MEYPTWYIDLQEFFPVEEMKRYAHLAALLSNSDKHYQLLQTNEYILLYVNHPNFIHIDYLYVYPQMRRNGIGAKLIAQLHQQYPDKLFILEAENENCPEDAEMIAKRLKFYRNVGFRCRFLYSYLPQFYFSPEIIPRDAKHILVEVVYLFFTI